MREVCLTATHCSYCIDGSEYTPGDRRVLFPTVAQRRADRKAVRRRPAGRRGQQDRQRGLKAEREPARAFYARVVPGSGIWDGLPNDLGLPAGWRAEARERTGQFGLLYRGTAREGVVPGTEPDGPVYVAITRSAYHSGFRPAPVAHMRAGDFREIRRWFAVEGADVLVCRRPHHRWLVVMDAAHWRQMADTREALDLPHV